MGRKSRKYLESVGKYDKAESLSLEEAVGMLKSFPQRRYDETVELGFLLGIDGRQAEQAIRGTVMLPHGTGKEIRVVVITQGELVAQAQEAGADHVGGADLIEKIQKGWLDFDLVIASPDMMGQVGRLGRILGPRGMMPNPKTGTVTVDVAKAVGEIQAGKVAYRVDKAGVVHAPIGKTSFAAEKLVENANALALSVIKAKPVAAKGKYVKSVVVSSTMGPGIPVDGASVEAAAK